jgi:uncharacterized Zn finger protein
MRKRPANKTKIGGAQQFDVATLRAVAGEKVFARGVIYHENKQVEITAIDKTRVVAKVIGSELYRSEEASKIISHMQVIRKRLGANADQVAYVADLMSRHKAKRNFMKLLQV